VLACLTYTTFEHAPYFTDARARGIVRTQFLRASIENRSEILAYGFAPDIAQVLIETEAADAFVRASRIYAARVFRIRTSMRLWDREAKASRFPNPRAAAESVRGVLALPASGSFAWDRLECILSAESALTNTPCLRSSTRR
jgi:hypothetical protein